MACHQMNVKNNQSAASESQRSLAAKAAKKKMAKSVTETQLENCKTQRRKAKSGKYRKYQSSA
jgi:hypothetical protein